MLIRCYSESSRFYPTEVRFTLTLLGTKQREGRWAAVYCLAVKKKKNTSQMPSLGVPNDNSVMNVPPGSFQKC